MILRMNESVRRVVDVPLSINRAFILFTTGMTDWWSPENTLGKQDYDAVVIEPRPGGRWYERDIDGNPTDWGRVLVWIPPYRVMLTWQVTPEGFPEPDPTKASEIDIRFVALGASRTRVEIEHHDFERHGDEDGRLWYEAMDSEASGWTHLLNNYVEASQEP